MARVLHDMYAARTARQVIHNAGVLTNDSLADCAASEIREQFNVNALAPLMFAKALEPHLKHGSRYGLVSSLMGSIDDNGSGGMYGYRVSKVALNMIGKGLSVDWKEKGIAVCLLHPGLVETNMTSCFGVKAGEDGCIDTATSARGIIAVLSKLNLETSGKFYEYTGEELPW
jgi:NAD(P)-dependent dehydrogenase (short-subunit alcohol dehydrogenase family)